MVGFVAGWATDVRARRAASHGRNGLRTVTLPRASHRARVLRMQASKHATTGFVNCGTCGSDVVVELEEFRLRDATDVRCSECGARWVAEFKDVDVLCDGQIQKAGDMLNKQKTGDKAAVRVMGSFRRSIRIWVGNLPARVGDEDLEALFNRYGEVTSARVIFDRNTRRSRGFGFIEMADEGEGRAAIQDLDGTRDLGNKIAVRQAESL